MDIVEARKAFGDQPEVTLEWTADTYTLNWDGTYIDTLVIGGWVKATWPDGQITKYGESMSEALERVVEEYRHAR